MSASARVLLPVGVAGLLVLSGCSGGGDSSNPQPAEPTASDIQSMQQSAAGFVGVNEMGAAVTDALAAALILVALLATVR